MTTMLGFSLIMLLLATADGGAVGECRTECVERNQFKIVRVHLKDDFVMVGICENKTTTDGVSLVSPYICNKLIGVWTFDPTEPEGIRAFNVNCPSVAIVPIPYLEACPTDKL